MNVSDLNSRRVSPSAPDWVLEAVFKGMGEAIVVWDDDDKMLYCSSAYLDLWRLPREHSWIGRTMDSVVRYVAESGGYDAGTPDEMARQRLLEIQRAREVGHEIRTISDGRTLRVRHFPHPGFGHVTVQTDITNLIEGEKAFEEVLDRSPLAVGIIATENQRRLFVNHALVNLYRASGKSALLSCEVDTSWVNPEDLAEFRRRQEGCVDIHNYPCLRRRKDGTEIWLLLTSRHMTYRGEPARVVWHQDITSIMKAEERLRELNDRLEAQVTARTAELKAAKVSAETANNAKSEFLACLSHEFRTPLNAISGCAEIMQLGVFGEVPDKYREYVDDIMKASGSLNTMVDELLGLSQAENGQIVPTQAKFDPRSVIHDAIASMAHIVPEKPINIVIEVDDNLHTVLFDEDHLRRILTNLLSNAIKFAPENSAINVSLQQWKNGFTLSVTDEGPGIPTEFLEKLGEPFTQHRRNHQVAHAGLGLGLHVVNILCQLNGAEWSVDSRVRKGTTVTISAPGQ